MNLANLDPKKREQYLMIFTGVMLVIAVIPLSYYLFGANITAMQNKITEAEEEIEKLEIRQRAMTKYEKDIRQNAADALPPVQELAAAEYKNWLTSLLSTFPAQNQNQRIHNFEGAQVTNTVTSPQKAPTNRNQRTPQGPDTNFTVFKFNISGKTTLMGLGAFLQKFYEVKTPHLIRRMTISPIENAQRVNVSIDIEAISIPQTKNVSFIAEYKENQPDWSTSIASLVDRNFFVAFRRQDPAPPRVPPVPVTADKFTYLNGITWSNGQGQAWFDFRLEGRQRFFKVGDNFRIGTANCQIDAINDDLTVDVSVTSRDRDTGQPIQFILPIKRGETIYDAFNRDEDEQEDASQQTVALQTVSG